MAAHGVVVCGWFATSVVRKGEVVFFQSPGSNRGWRPSILSDFVSMTESIFPICRFGSTILRRDCKLRRAAAEHVPATASSSSIRPQQTAPAPAPARCRVRTGMPSSLCNIMHVVACCHSVEWFVLCRFFGAIFQPKEICISIFLARGRALPPRLAGTPPCKCFFWGAGGRG